MLLSHNCVGTCAAHFCTCTQMSPGSIFAINQKLSTFVHTCRNLPCLHRCTAGLCWVLDTWKTLVTYMHTCPSLNNGAAEEALGKAIHSMVSFYFKVDRTVVTKNMCTVNTIICLMLSCCFFSGDPTGLPTRLTLEFSAFDM